MGTGAGGGGGRKLMSNYYYLITPPKSLEGFIEMLQATKYQQVALKPETNNHAN